MRIGAGWLLLGLVVVGALAWWLAREQPTREQTHARRARAEAAARDAQPALYRWRHADGVLHVSETPPAHGPYERVARDAPAGIEVRGNRD